MSPFIPLIAARSWLWSSRSLSYLASIKRYCKVKLPKTMAVSVASSVIIAKYDKLRDDHYQLLAAIGAGYALAWSVLRAAMSPFIPLIAARSWLWSSRSLSYLASIKRYCKVKLPKTMAVSVASSVIIATSIV